MKKFDYRIYIKITEGQNILFVKEQKARVSSQLSYFDDLYHTERSLEGKDLQLEKYRRTE